MRFVAILKGTVNICPQNGQQAVKEVLSSKGARQRERGEESVVLAGQSVSPNTPCSVAICFWGARCFLRDIA